MTWWELYEITLRTLKDMGNDCFRSDADNIFRYCFNMNKTQIVLNKDKEIILTEKNKISEILEKRKMHIPLQYILGTWNFMDLEFKVGDGVLIPREDTSVLVNESVNFLSDESFPKIIDLCSGSGCVAIALEKILKNSPKIYGVEISEKAFKYLKENIKEHSSKVTAINEDIFTVYEKFDDCFFDAIISNPPYIKTSDVKNLQLEVQFEPILALDGGRDGLDFYKEICECWAPKLKKGGLLAFELGIGQFEDVKKLMLHKGFENIKGIKDINDIDRVITGVKNI